MSMPLDITCEWLPHQSGADLELGAAGKLTILVNELCVTEFEDRFTKTVHRDPGLSALRMARWFVGNWWRLCWEPEAQNLDWQMSHNLATAGGGYLWPSLVFSSDGETMRIQACASSPADGEPIRYLKDYIGVIMAADFERAIDDFVEATLSHLPDGAEADTDLAELWGIIADERNDPELRDLRKLEALLGYDPDEAPTDLIAGLGEERSKYGADALQELAAASKGQALNDLKALGENVTNQKPLARVPNCDAIRQRYEKQAKPWDAPWQRGAQLAQTVREVWGLKTDQVQTQVLSNLLGFDLSKDMTGELPMRAAGLRDQAEDTFHVVLKRSRRLENRRFALSRLVADHLIAPLGDVLLPATDARTSRQKLQRAFAQELLCPINALKDFLGINALQDSPLADDDIDEAAAHFEVSPLVIKTALVNKRLMEPQTLDYAA